MRELEVLTRSEYELMAVYQMGLFVNGTGYIHAKLVPASLNRALLVPPRGPTIETSPSNVKIIVRPPTLMNYDECIAFNYLSGEIDSLAAVLMRPKNLKLEVIATIREKGADLSFMAVSYLTYINVDVFGFLNSPIQHPQWLDYTQHRYRIKARMRRKK